MWPILWTLSSWVCQSILARDDIEFSFWIFINQPTKKKKELC